MNAWLVQHRFALFKYFVYLALAANVGFFFIEEWLATQQVFQDGMAWGELIQGFAATIDTAAWVVLLLMFEMETYQLAGYRLSAAVTTTFMAIRGLCYGLIVYACYGYLLKVFALDGYHLVTLAADCDYIELGYGMLVAVDEFDALTVTNCSALPGLVYLNEASKTLAVPATFADVSFLAWIDVVNSISWILVVINLELDVWLGLNQSRTKAVGWFSRRLKFLLYSILVIVAGYWGWAGDFLDFWDAFLWILAFVFIERSVFVWGQETDTGLLRGAHS